MATIDNACAECGAPVGGGHTGHCSKSAMRSGSETVRAVTVEDTRAYLEDQAALIAGGDDAIDRAVSYMRHILERESAYHPDAENGELVATHAVLVIQCGEGSRARTVYAASDHEMTRVQVQGMLYDALRGLAMMIGKTEGPEPPRSLSWWRRVLLPWLAGAR
jgi:hypothetical protein